MYTRYIFSSSINIFLTKIFWTIHTARRHWQQIWNDACYCADLL